MDVTINTGVHIFFFIFSQKLFTLLTSLKAFLGAPAKTERIRVGKIIGCFNCQGLQDLSVYYSNVPQSYLLNYLLKKIALSVSEGYLAMSKTINLLLLFSQVYVTQILQGQRLQKVVGLMLNMSSRDHFVRMLQ